MSDEWVSAYGVSKLVGDYPSCEGKTVTLRFGDGRLIATRSPQAYNWNADIKSSADNTYTVVAWRYSTATEEVYAGSSVAYTKSVVSTGGSSSYYELSISNKHGEILTCETGDVIAALVGDNFALGNIVKALRRIYESSQGRGKTGVTMEYDVNKCKYFLDDFLARHSRKDNSK